MGTETAVRDYAVHVSPSLLPVAATLLALAGIRDGETVVDLGCGAGLLTHPAAAAAGPGARVFGLDSDPAALTYARARRSNAICWVNGGGERLPFAGGQVHKVMCGGPFGRLGDPAAVVAEVARVLVPGGRVAVAAWEAFRGLAENAAADVLGPPVPGAPVPGLLAEGGLHLVYDRAEDVVVPFATGATYAAWRSALTPSADAGAVAALAARLGDAPVVAQGRVRFVTART